MIKLISAIIVSSLISNTAAANSSSKTFYVGEKVKICYSPDEIVHKPDVNGSPYFLNYNSESKDSTYLTIVIWSHDIPKLEINPYSYFSSDNLCLEGNITTYRERKQLVIREIDQLVINTK